MVLMISWKKIKEKILQKFWSFEEVHFMKLKLKLRRSPGVQRIQIWIFINESFHFEESFIKESRNSLPLLHEIQFQNQQFIAPKFRTFGSSSKVRDLYKLSTIRLGSTGIGVLDF